MPEEVFTSDDWARLVAAPMVAAMAVTAADPGGLWGTLKESAASAKGVLAARGSDNALIASVVSAYETSDGRGIAQEALRAQVRGRKPSEMVEAAVAELGAVASLVAEKAPDEAPAFKAWLREIAEKVAEAGTEGGFLGFGGEKVSVAEKATLARIDATLA